MSVPVSVHNNSLSSRHNGCSRGALQNAEYVNRSFWGVGLVLFIGRRIITAFFHLFLVPFVSCMNASNANLMLHPATPERSHTIASPKTNSPTAFDYLALCSHPTKTLLLLLLLVRSQFPLVMSQGACFSPHHLRAEQHGGSDDFGTKE